MATIKLVSQDIDELEAPYAEDMDALEDFSFDDDETLESEMKAEEGCTFSLRGHEWGHDQKPTSQWTRNSTGSSRWIRGEQRYE